MLRTFLRFVSSSQNPPVQLPTQTDRPDQRQDVSPLPHCHRERLLSMRLEHTRICSKPRCEMLREVGVTTAGDLMTCDVTSLEETGAPRKVIRMIKRYRQVIRLAASVPGMMPRDAQLLVSVHRRSIDGLAAESPAALHRDLVRFSLSSKGRRLIRGRKLPSVRRLRKYITSCKTAITAANDRAANQGASAAASSIVFARTI